MFRNYCRLAWRNLLANKGYTLINIVGLATGLSVCLFILLFIFYETSYDKQQPGIDRLYRVGTSFKSKVDQSAVVSSNALIAAGLRAEMPEVEQAGRLLAAPKRPSPSGYSARPIPSAGRSGRVFLLSARLL